MRHRNSVETSVSPDVSDGKARMEVGLIHVKGIRMCVKWRHEQKRKGGVIKFML